MGWLSSTLRRPEQRSSPRAARIPDLATLFVDQPHVEWTGDRPYCCARLTADYAKRLEDLAHDRETAIKALPVDPAWKSIAKRNTTTSRFRAYSTFLLDPVTLPLFFAVRETYRHLLAELGEPPAPRFIQSWCNIHRAGQSIVCHAHAYPFIGTFSAHAEGSFTRYGHKEPSDTDAMIEHVDGLLMVTTGPEHYHETSVWSDAQRPRVTYAFDIVNVGSWTSEQVFLPFDT